MEEEIVVKSTRVKEIVKYKRRLVEVPYTASVGDTLNVLLANNILAVPVAAPPGQWIGAGGSMILESDKATGAIRKHYIGMVSMLDILVHLAESESDDVGANLMAVPVSSIIGHCLEGLSLWTVSPNTSVLDVMEPLSKGIHRALVPLESHQDHVAVLELKETSPGYRMLTQMDIVQFLKLHSNKLKSFMSTSVGQLGAVHSGVFAVPANMQVASAVKCMQNTSLNAVAIVEGSVDSQQGPMLITGEGRRLVGTFSSSDLRGCPLGMLQSQLSLSVFEFTEKNKGEQFEYNPGAAASAAALTSITPGSRPLVTCLFTSALEEVISKAVNYHIHRVWVVDEVGSLVGLVALTDMLRAIRTAIVAQDASGKQS
uniref:CBS domain-containing protein n=1 Tax=Araucaria cunninghamii TaxID=56994 RepID=A0A0D6R3W3_ARACU